MDLVGLARSPVIVWMMSTTRVTITMDDRSGWVTDWWHSASMSRPLGANERCAVFFPTRPSRVRAPDRDASAVDYLTGNWQLVTTAHANLLATVRPGGEKHGVA